MNRILLLITFFIILTQNISGQSKEELCKKWLLDGYMYKGVNMPPNQNEKHDFIHLNTDNTFTSIDDGKFERGTWELDLVAKTIHLFGKSSKGHLTLKLIRLLSDKMIIILEDEHDTMQVVFKTK